MSDISMSEEYPKVGGTPTYVVKYGDISANKILILIIPGNPGNASYYKDFMQTLYNNSNRQLPVWCISHANHGLLPATAGTDENKLPYYGLRDQTRHKLCYIRDYIPEDIRLILIGHSIGCYFILEIMKELDPSRILKAMLLFPTIERLADTPHGRLLTPIIKCLSWVTPLMAYAFYHLIPMPLKNIIIQWYFRSSCVSKSVIEATRLICNPASVKNIVSMGCEELYTVVKVDDDVIDENLSKLMFYYGATDHWCPVEYYEEMKLRHPLGDIHLCQHRYDHAFVLRHSQQMADICWTWIAKHVELKHA